MNSINKQKNNQGMSLLESILAVGLVMSVIVGSITMGIYTSQIGRTSNNKIIALNLAREGIEYIRNLRDSNWLKESEGIENEGQTYLWDDGIEGGTFTLNQYKTGDEWVSELVASDGFSTCEPACLLKINSEGIYNHTAGSNTIFSRIITIKKESVIQVISKVRWLEKGRERIFTLEENLFDWRYD